MSTEKPPQCSQCNNPAFAIEFGPFLCLACFSKRPIEVPSPTRLATYALNVGTVQHIEAALTNIRVRGGEDVAAALAELMQAVLDSKDLAPQARTAAFAQVDYLATQATEPAPKRQKAAGKLVIDGLKVTLGVAKDVATIWQTVEPILRRIATVDREQLRRDLSDALARVQQDQDVADLDVLAASLIALEGQYAFHGEQLLKALEPVPRSYNADIWNLVQVLDKLEGGSGGRGEVRPGATSSVVCGGLRLVADGGRNPRERGRRDWRTGVTRSAKYRCCVLASARTI